MSGMRAHTEDITGIIAVTDSGRSTGKVRVALDVPAPGDVRNALRIANAPGISVPVVWSLASASINRASYPVTSAIASSFP